SIVVVFSSRRSRVSSARSSLVSGPCGSRLASISACFTQARTAVSVRSSSRTIWPMLLPLERTRPTTSALYSFVNFRLFRRSMDPVSNISLVSTNSGQAQEQDAREAVVGVVAVRGDLVVAVRLRLAVPGRVVRVARRDVQRVGLCGEPVGQVVREIRDLSIRV